MFLSFFLVFTLVFTIFENISLAGISLLLVFIGMLIYQLISKKKILSKKMAYFVLGGFVLAGISFGVKEYMYYESVDSFFQGNNVIVGTGIISDISTQGKYIFTYKNDDYLLYSKKTHSIGDQVRMVGRLQGNTKKDGFSYRNISTGIFAVPLFSGSFDFNKRMKMKGWKGSIYEDNSLTINNDKGGMINDKGKNSKIGVIKKMKKGIQERVIEAYGKNRISGLILGMLIGDRSQIPEADYQSFINSGLVHLVAVSGGNILMIVIFLQCILFFIPFYIRLGLILLTIIGYSLICGLDSSVFRAVVMGGLSMVALFWGREINIWRLLSISCIIMLMINPYFLAYDTGFLLSYSALIGIIYFEELKGKKIETLKNGKIKTSKISVIKKSLQYIYKSYISPSIGASIGIFPIIIFFMGKINILGIVGNLFVLPLIPFVMIYGFIGIWLYSWLGYPWLLWIEKILVQYIYKISELLSEYGLYLSVSGLRFKYLMLVIFLGFFIFWQMRTKEIKDK